MSPISIGILAISMSIDAFVASIGKGASAQSQSFRHALKTGAIFGVIETLTPLLGWMMGIAASQYVEAVDHWIAFTLLGIVGGHMILQSWKRKTDHKEVLPSSLRMIIITAIATSIDAMAVGISLAFLNVNIIVIALAIGLTTTIMSSIGILTGRFLSDKLGRIAEAFGGCTLIALGIMILCEHIAG